MKKKRLNNCDLYIGLSVIYYLQGIAYPQGAINQIIQAVFILWSIFYALKAISRYRFPLVLKATMLLVVMYIAYGLPEIITQHTHHITQGGLSLLTRPYVYLQNALNSLLPIFVLFYFSKKGMLTVGRIKIYVLVFFVLSVLMYMDSYKEQLASAILKRTGRKEFTINIGYQFISLIPCLFFYKNKTFRYILLLAIMFFVMICVKRGAILTGGVLAIWFLWANIRHSRKPLVKFTMLFVAVAVLICAVAFIQHQYDTSPYFRQRIEATMEGNTSGRDKISADIIDELKNDPSTVHLFFGRGANMTIDVARNFAHQDWLELACNNGLLGVCLGMFFYISILITGRRLKPRLIPQYHTMLLMVCFALFLPTMFSMSLANMKPWAVMPMCFIIALGPDVLKTTENRVTQIS